MIGDRRPDDAVRAWVRSGPEAASAEFVERTLRPIPRMRQRRSWRIALERFGQPIGAVAGAVAIVIALVIGVGALALRPGVGAPVPTASSSPAGANRATFELRVTGGPGEGTYAADPATTLNTCRESSTGVWSLLYAGGTPFVNMDLVVGADARRPGGSNQVAMELNAGPGYLRFDPAALRGGDPPGRSTAHVEVQPGAGSTTMVIDANTPDGSSASDTKAVRVQLTVTCPN